MGRPTSIDAAYRDLQAMAEVPVPTIPDSVRTLPEALAHLSSYARQLDRIARNKEAKLASRCRVMDVITEACPWLEASCHRLLVAECDTIDD